MCSSSCSNIVYSKVISSGSHRSLSAPACCRTASPRRQRASCTTPTGTGGTGHPRWPTPDSARPQHPGTARGKYTPDPPTSGASTPTRARPPLRSRMRPCRLDAPVMRSDVALRCVAEKPGTKIPDNVFGSVFTISVLKNVEQLPSRSCERDCTALVTHLCCTCRVLVPICPVHKPSLNDSFTNRNETVRAVIEWTIHQQIEPSCPRRN